MLFPDITEPNVHTITMQSITIIMKLDTIYRLFLGDIALLVLGFGLE